jgi:protein involved in polysaccharide export with SLBB domain
MGLVRAPGTYPFAPDSRMSLVAAVGLAGGVDPIGDPRYATVYRQDAGGKLVSLRFPLNGGDSWLTKASLFADSSLGDGAFAALKPGDVIFVEKDARTRTRTILARVVGVQVGASANARTEATYYKDYSASGGTKVRQ